MPPPQVARKHPRLPSLRAAWAVRQAAESHLRPELGHARSHVAAVSLGEHRSREPSSGQNRGWGRDNLQPWGEKALSLTQMT